MLDVRDRSVATSGGYERGDHITDPRTGAVPRDLLSVTVVGPSLTWADAYATAAFVMGREGLGWVASHPGYGALAITAEDRTLWTPTIGPLLVPHTGAHDSQDPLSVGPQSGLEAAFLAVIVAHASTRGP